ncbi:MAG: VWA domain-containing protein [bacterium]|nr:VWA domain-containing protein [bacterium]
MIAGWTWTWPDYWPWLLGLGLAAGWTCWRARRRRVHVQALLGPRDSDVAGRVVGGGLRFGLAGLGCAAVLLALLQPQAPAADAEPEQPSYVIALDVSWSMAAQDVGPSRLARAVADVGELAELARGARVGLVAFSGDARLVVPLTADLHALHARAERLVPGAELLGGTDLGAAILAGVEALAGGAVAAGGIDRPTGNAIAGEIGSVLVLTDGEDFAGVGRVAAERARERGVEVHCVGYGTEVGSKIAVTTENGQEYLRDETGAEIVSALDPATLGDLATAGGGEFRIAGADNPLLALHRGRLTERAAEVRAVSGRVALTPRFQWPLLAALLSWMLLLLVPERRR